MAFPSDARRAKQRREEENQRARAEQRRREALERRQEEEREREREGERRQEALRQAQEFEAALETAQQQRAALLARLRLQRRGERRETARQEARHDALLEILRAANRQEQREAEQGTEHREERRQQGLAERQSEQRQADQRASRQIARRESKLEEQRAAARSAEQTESRRAAARQARLEEQQGAERAAVQEEARREAARQSRQEEARAANRTSENLNERRRQGQEQGRASREAKASERLEASRQGDREERQRTQRQADQDAARQEAARQSRLDEQRETARLNEHAQEQRTAARQARLGDQRAAARNAGQAESRRAAERQARLEEQRQADRDAERAQARRDALREGRLGEERAARVAKERGARQREQQTPVHNPPPDRISTAMLSGSIPWLRVNGNRMVTLDGSPLLLRGVNLLGMESAVPDPERGFAAGAGITEETIDTILDWGADIIRLAINHRRILHGFGNWGAWDYLADLDWMIERAARGGAYTLLSLRRLDDLTVFGTLPGANGVRSPNYIAPQPDYDAIGLWRLLGERYEYEPAVLFDLYTAPHKALDDDLTGFNTDWDLWTVWVRLMVAELRRMHPRAVCFVSGLDWAADLSGFPVLGTDSKPIPNLVYTTHLYPRRGGSWSAIRALSRSHPVFVTEWGGGRLEVSWGEHTALSLSAAGCGWTAAHWNDDPPLTQVADHRLVPTSFGAVIRRALAMNTRRLDHSSPTVPALLNT